MWVKEGSKVLDMGCGWGPFLKYIKEKKGALEFDTILT